MLCGCRDRHGMWWWRHRSCLFCLGLGLDAAVLLTDQRMAAILYQRLSLHTALLLSSDCLTRCLQALNNLGVLHRERGNLERAAQCYTAALQIRPNFPQVREAHRLGLDC